MNEGNILPKLTADPMKEQAKERTVCWQETNIPLLVKNGFVHNLRADALQGGYRSTRFVDGGKNFHQDLVFPKENGTSSAVLIKGLALIVAPDIDINLISVDDQNHLVFSGREYVPEPSKVSQIVNTYNRLIVDISQ